VVNLKQYVVLPRLLNLTRAHPLSLRLRGLDSKSFYSLCSHCQFLLNLSFAACELNAVELLNQIASSIHLKLGQSRSLMQTPHLLSPLSDQKHDLQTQNDPQAIQ
jgi:hypothetical protein